jgi:hypothetical protein
LAGVSVNMSASGNAVVELDKDDLTSILREAVKISVERREARKKPAPSAGASDEA